MTHYNLGQVARYQQYFYALMLVVVGASPPNEKITIVDVGFNTGQFSRLAEQFMKREYPDRSFQIIGFEPNPALVKHAPAIDNLRLIECGVGCEEGTGVLNVPCFPGEATELDTGVSSGHRAPDGGIYGTSTMSSARTAQLANERPDIPFVSVPVKVHTLDNVLMAMGVQKVHWLKIDVETFERQVFLGAQSLMASGKILGGQFEGDTAVGSQYWSSVGGMGNDAATQQLLDVGGLLIIDSKGTPVKLPAPNNMHAGKFFFLNKTLLVKAQ